jgi:hypothetical protein
MGKKDYLIQLIESLSPNERRYFKLSGSIQPGEKKYVQLFEVLEDKDEYDPKEISKQLGITAKQLADQKYYLPQVILRVLRNAEEQSSDIGIVYRLKEDAVSLASRRLFDYSLDVIDKALDKARQLEIFEVIGELLLTKHICLLNLQRYDELSVITTEYQKAMNALSELFEIYAIRGEATGLAANPKKASELKKLLAHPLLKGKMQNLKSLKAQIAWIHIKTLIFGTTNSVADLLVLAREEVSHFKKHPAIKVINPVAYYVSFTHLANAYTSQGNHEEALKIMEDLKRILKPSPQINKARIDSIWFYVEMSCGTIMADMKRYREASERLVALIPKMDNRPLAEQYEILFYSALSLMHQQRPADALDRVDELLRKKDDLSGRFQLYVRPLMLLIQLQLGNYTLIPYLVKSSKSWMQRQKLNHPEADLLFKQLLASAKPSLLPRQDALKKLEKLIDNGSLADMNKVLNLKDWASAKRKQQQ